MISLNGWTQPVPSKDENIPFACTFSKSSSKDWGDDDFVQVLFFLIPESYKKPIYIRVYDPDLGGSNDENHGPFNSKTKFTVYGGFGAHSNNDNKLPDPSGNYKSGLMLCSKTFADDKIYDNNWYTIGPFNPIEGEYQPEIGGRVFKIVIEGLDGDDGNLYKLFLSTQSNENVSVEGANAFAYEYSFRLEDNAGAVSHLYPFIAPNVTAVKIRIFDYDNEGVVRVISAAKKGDIKQLSENSKWMESVYKIGKTEINTSMDIQFIKQKNIKNNNIVVNMSNQYGELMPFFSSPIGGIPKFNYKIGVKAED
jgi:hypothetical protein